MTKEEAIKVAAPYFKQHPDVKEFHITKDKFAFFRENDAISHAADLGNGNEVVTVERSLTPTLSKGEGEATQSGAGKKSEEIDTKAGISDATTFGKTEEVAKSVKSAADKKKAKGKTTAKKAAANKK